MNKDKVIKDLKERNDKLKNQYEYQGIRLYHLEYKYNKQKEVLDKIKKYIKEEKEEYEKGKLLYKELGRELEQYMKGQLVAYENVEKLLEEIE